MLPLTLEKPSVSAWLMAWRSMAWLTARRRRRSCQGDFGSHWSAKYTQNGDRISVGLSVRPLVRCSSSARAPRTEYTTSTSPRLRAARRDDSSGITRKTSRFTLGALRQYPSKASSTSSTPGVKETNR